MSLDVRPQLATYGRYLEELAPPVAPEEYEPSRALPLRRGPAPKPPSRLRRGTLVALGTAVVVLLLVGAAALVFDASDEVADETPVTTIAPPPTTAGPTPTAAPAPPAVGIIDPAAQFAETVLAVAPDGRTFVAYSSEGTLTLVRCGDSACSVSAPIYQALPDDGGVPGFDLALQFDGSPVLARDAESGVRVVVCGDPDCTTQSGATATADYLVGLYVDQSDVPTVLLMRDEGLVAVACATPSCEAFGAASLIGPGLSGDVDIAASLVLDPGGLPAIAYWGQADGARSEIFLVRCAAADCAVVASTVGLGRSSAPETGVSLSVPADDLPVILYEDEATGLRVLKCGDPACANADTIQLSMPLLADPGFAALAVAVDGNPVISYPAEAGLMVATCEDPACTGVTVRKIAPSCRCSPTSIALNQQSIPVVVFSDEAGLRVITCADPTCGAGTGVEPPPPPPPPPTIPPLEQHGAWLQTPPDEAGFSSGVLNQRVVATTASGLVALGRVCESDDSCADAGWFSSDGRSWEQFTPPAGFNGSTEVAFAEGGPGIVALVPGGDIHPDLDPDIRRPDSLIYGSSDGVTWEQLAVLATQSLSADGELNGIHAVSLFRAPDGLVAYGFEHGAGTVIWTSVDASSWTRVPLDPGFLDTSPLGSRLIHGMAAVGPVYFMWGEMWSGEGEPFDIDVAAWRSTDLLNWEFVGPPVESPTSFLNTGVTWPGGLLLRGALADEGGAWLGENETFWTTNDGTTWQTFEADPDIFVEWGGEILAAGPVLFAISDDERGQALWRSSDGMIWELFDAMDGLPGNADVAFTGTTFVALGNTDDGLATSWIWTPDA